MHDQVLTVPVSEGLGWDVPGFSASGSPHAAVK